MSYGCVGESGMIVSSSGRAAVARVVGAHARHGLEVVLRQEREQVARLVAERVLVVGDEVRDARALRVRVGAAEILEARPPRR